MPVLTAFKKAQGWMSRDDTAGKLVAAALNELQAIVTAQREAEARIDRQAKLLSACAVKAQRASTALKESLENGASESDVYAALENYHVAQGVEERAMALSRELQVQRYLQEKELPTHARDVLVRACQHRLAEAKERHAAALAQEEERLGREYDANDSPVVKKQAARIQALEIRLQRITSNEPLEQVWIAFALPLLDNE